MSEKHNQNKVNKMIIAFYQRPFNKKSVKKIEELFDAKKPDEVLLLSITEQKESTGTIESYLGRKDVERLKGQFEKDRKIRASGYADKILKISEKRNISTKKIERKGNIINIINEEINKHQPDTLVINHSEKSQLEKLITGCIEEEILEKCKNNIIIV